MKRDQEATIRDILANSRTIAVVGLSDDPQRPSHRVAKYLQQQGYRIIPVNPNIEAALGEKSYPDLASVPEPVDVVDVFRRPEYVPDIINAAIEIEAGAIWLQDGITSPEAEQRAREMGIAVVSDTCMAREHRHLMRQGLKRSA